jgi:hypothetical protein
MVFLIILFLLYFIAMDHSSFSSYTYSSQFSVYYFSFYNVSPSCSATFLNRDTEKKDNREERQAVFPTALAGETPNHAGWSCDVKKITAVDSTLTGKIYPSFS